MRLGGAPRIAPEARAANNRRGGRRAARRACLPSSSTPSTRGTPRLLVPRRGRAAAAQRRGGAAPKGAAGARRDADSVARAVRTLRTALELLLVRGGILSQFPDLPRGRRDLGGRRLSAAEVRALMARVNARPRSAAPPARSPSAGGSGPSTADGSAWGGAPVPVLPVRAPGAVSVSTVHFWSGARGRPRKEDRCAAPLLASATPNALGAWFAPGRAGRLTDVAAWFCLATSRRDNAPHEEQRERLRETIRLFQGPQARRPAAPPARAPTPFPANAEAPRRLGSSARRAPRAVHGAERARGARTKSTYVKS